MSDGIRGSRTSSLTLSTRFEFGVLDRLYLVKSVDDGSVAPDHALPPSRHVTYTAYTVSLLCVTRQVRTNGLLVAAIYGTF